MIKFKTASFQMSQKAFLRLEWALQILRCQKFTQGYVYDKVWQNLISGILKILWKFLQIQGLYFLGVKKSMEINNLLII